MGVVPNISLAVVQLQQHIAGASTTNMYATNIYLNPRRLLIFDLLRKFGFPKEEDGENTRLSRRIDYAVRFLCEVS